MQYNQQDDQTEAKNEPDQCQPGDAKDAWPDIRGADESGSYEESGNDHADDQIAD